MNYNLNELDINNIPSEIVYDICLNNEVDLNSEPNTNIDQNEVSRILKHYNLERFSSLMTRDSKICLIPINKNRINIDFNVRIKQGLEQSIVLTKALLMLVNSKKENSEIDIRLRDIHDTSVLLNCNELLQPIEIEILWLLFKRGVGVKSKNKIIVKELINNIDNDWVKSKLKSFSNNQLDLKSVPPIVPETLIRSFSTNHRFKHHLIKYIDIDSLPEKLKIMEDEIIKISIPKGAKSKNHLLGTLAIKLRCLHDFDDFINQSEVSSITEFPISNNVCRFIYEIFSLWKLLDPIIQEELDVSSDENKRNYIKSILKRKTKTFTDNRIFKEDLKQLPINQIWALKNPRAI